MAENACFFVIIKGDYSDFLKKICILSENVIFHE